MPGSRPPAEKLRLLMVDDDSMVVTSLSRALRRRCEVVAATSTGAAIEALRAQGPFDAIVSNPPYVKDRDRGFIQRAVVRYEPHVALFGGADGLDGVQAVAGAAATRLVPGGWLIFEFGLGQDAKIEELIAGYPDLRLDHIRADLQGIPRTAVVRHR